MTSERIYRRLPGRNGLFIRHSIWVGPDHLLRVRASPFAQEYRRYYFKDIQALVLTELARPTVYFFYVLGAFFTALFAVLILSGHPVWATLCTLPALLLFYLGWRAPNCACRIHTRVSSDWLPSLGKVHNAQKALAVIRSQITLTQGELGEETLKSHVFTNPPVSGPAISAPELRQSNAWAHWTLFSLLVLRCILLLFALAFTIRSVSYGLAGDAVGGAVLLTGVLALIQQYRYHVAPGARWIVYGSLLWQAISFMAAMGFTGYVGVQLALKRNSILTTLESTTRFYQAADAAVYLLLGSAGIFLLWRVWRATAPPPVVTTGEVPTMDHQ